MSLHYFVKSEMLIGHVLLPRNSRNYPTTTGAPKFARFECRWLRDVGTIGREDVQNAHHWSRWTETATENGLGHAGSCRHCGNDLSMASLIAPDQWCMSCNISHIMLSTAFKS